MSTDAHESPHSASHRGSTAASSAEHHHGASQVDPQPQHDRVVDTQKRQFGGMKFGSAFFGWLAATGMAVLLTALVAAAGTAVGLGTGTDPAQLGQVASTDPGTIGLIGGIAVLTILLVAYYCGGYVAGRMARFNGLKQGLAVWLWAVVIAVVLAVIGLVAGSQFNVLNQLNAFPRLPLDGGTLSVGALVTVIAAAVVALVGALLGGLAGMRFHRRVDRATLIN